MPMRARALAALLVLAAGCATTQEVDDGLAIPEEEGELVEEPGFFGTHFPLFPAGDLAPAVDDVAAFVYLINLVPLGGLWGPLLLLDEDGRPEMGGDVVVPYLVPWLTGLVGGSCLGAPLLSVGALFGFAIGVGAAGGSPAACVTVPIATGCCAAPGCAMTVVPAALALWVAPTASINAWSRAYKTSADALPEQLPRRAPDQARPPGEGRERPTEPPDTEAQAPEAPEEGARAEGEGDEPAPAPSRDTPEGLGVETDDDGWVPY